MRISDWSSDVCSSDLGAAAAGEIQAALALALRRVAPGEISRCLLVVAGQRLVGRVGDTVAQRLQVEHAEQRVAAADVGIEEAQRPARLDRFDPQRHLGQFPRPGVAVDAVDRSEEHTSELQALLRNAYA